MQSHKKKKKDHVFFMFVRIMWHNMIFYDVSIINNQLFKISCEILQYFYDVKYWNIEICLLDIVD